MQELKSITESALPFHLYSSIHLTHNTSGKQGQRFLQSKVTDSDQEGKCSSGKMNILSDSNYSAIGIVREKSVIVDFRERRDFFSTEKFSVLFAQ